GAEADGLDEQDGHDDRMERAAERNEPARRPADPPRHQIARGKQADRQRQQDSEEGGDDRDLKALEDAAGDQLPAAEIRREHPDQKAVAMLDAGRKSLGAEPELGACVDDVEREQEPADARAPVRREGDTSAALVLWRHSIQLSPP